MARTAAETLDQLVWTVNAQNDTAGQLRGLREPVCRRAPRRRGSQLSVSYSAGPRRLASSAPKSGGRSISRSRRRSHNVVKHARATEVHISIGVEGEALVVEVADNGCGFTAGSGDPTGIGLGGMRERLAAVGGSAELTSAPGSGTRVVFRSPLLSESSRRRRTAQPASHAHAIPHQPQDGRH